MPVGARLLVISNPEGADSLLLRVLAGLVRPHHGTFELAGLIDTQRHGREVICRLRVAAFEELHESESRLIGGTAGIGLTPTGGRGDATEVADVG